MGREGGEGGAQRAEALCFMSGGNIMKKIRISIIK
jgi:hypothetical protein